MNQESVKKAGTVAAFGIAIGVTTVAFMHNWETVEKGFSLLGFGGQSDYAQDTKHADKTQYREELLTPEQRKAAANPANQDEADVKVAVIPHDGAKTEQNQQRQQAVADKTEPKQAKASPAPSPQAPVVKRAAKHQPVQKPESALQELGWEELATTAPTPKAAPSWESDGNDLLHKRIKANEKTAQYGYDKPQVHDAANISLESQYKKLGHSAFCAKYGTAQGKWFCNSAESQPTMTYTYNGATTMAAR